MCIQQHCRNLFCIVVLVHCQAKRAKQDCHCQSWKSYQPVQATIQVCGISPANTGFFFMQPQEQDVTSQNRPSSSATPEAHSFFALRRYHAELFSCLMHQVSATAASSRPEVTTAAANTPQDGDEWHGWIYSEARLWVKM